MISFQRLLGRQDEFFGLLEASAAECVASITALRAVLARSGEKPALDAFAAARRKDKELTQRLEEMLIHVFVTPIEREDIELLADKLYKIPKVIEKFAERYALVFDRVADVRFDGQAEALERAVELLRQMVAALHQADIAVIKSRQSELRGLARGAEIALAESLTTLYSPNNDPLKAIITRDLFDLLERAMERTREAAAVIAHILLKNS